MFTPVTTLIALGLALVIAWRVGAGVRRRGIWPAVFAMGTAVASGLPLGLLGGVIPTATVRPEALGLSVLVLWMVVVGVVFHAVLIGLFLRWLDKRREPKR
jgi:Na+/H+-dicarboxylate symporter